MKDFLLPTTDGGVAIQVVVGVILPSIALILVSRSHRDLAWFVGGLAALWIAFLAYRALH